MALANQKPDQEEFVITRVVAAPRETVWRSWTDPKHMSWWGPKGFKSRVARMDFKPGGMFHYCMQSSDGNEMWGKIIYREINAPSQLVFINCFSDEKGDITRHPMNPNWPRETLSTITFAEQEGKTLITVGWLPHNATDIECKTFAENFASMQQGWTGTFDQLEEYLAKG